MAAAPITPLPVVHAAQLEDAPPQRCWLVEQLWARAAVGIIGGMPKTALCRARHKAVYAASRFMPRAA